MTFICGRAGVCAIGAVVSAHLRDEAAVNHYLTLFNEVDFNSFHIFCLARQ